MRILVISLSKLTSGQNRMGLWHQRVEPSICPLPQPLPKSLLSTRMPRYAYNRIRSLFNLTETKRIATQIMLKKGANRSWPAPPSLPQVAEAAPQMTKTGQCGSCNAVHWDWTSPSAWETRHCPSTSSSDSGPTEGSQCFDQEFPWQQ